ncbi:MAG: hypothetical protein V4534_05250 [Myxococcota bacterium]
MNVLFTIFFAFTVVAETKPIEKPKESYEVPYLLGYYEPGIEFCTNYLLSLCASSNPLTIPLAIPMYPISLFASLDRTIAYFRTPKGLDRAERSQEMRIYSKLDPLLAYNPNSQLIRFIKQIMNSILPSVCDVYANSYQCQVAQQLGREDARLKGHNDISYIAQELTFLMTPLVTRLSFPRARPQESMQGPKANQIVVYRPIAPVLGWHTLVPAHTQMDDVSRIHFKMDALLMLVRRIAAEKYPILIMSLDATSIKKQLKFLRVQLQESTQDPKANQIVVYRPLASALSWRSSDRVQNIKNEVANFRSELLQTRLTIDEVSRTHTNIEASLVDIRSDLLQTSLTIDEVSRTHTMIEASLVDIRKEVVKTYDILATLLWQRLLQFAERQACIAPEIATLMTPRVVSGAPDIKKTHSKSAILKLEGDFADKRCQLLEGIAKIKTSDDYSRIEIRITEYAKDVESALACQRLALLQAYSTDEDTSHTRAEIDALETRLRESTVDMYSLAQKTLEVELKLALY